MPDGSIVLMGGYGLYRPPYYKNDVWRSTNNGATWTQMTAGAGWSARLGHSSVAMPDGSIVLMGGATATTTYKNDVWRSTDNGASWTQMTASAEWSARYRHTSVAMPDGSIVLMGGAGSGGSHKNDVWRSTDNGASWTQMTASAGWTARNGHSTVAMPDGSIVLMGGYGLYRTHVYLNDVWRSTNNGATWTQMTAGAVTYTVVLTATNSAGSNTLTRTSYITVNPAFVTPVANFVGTPTTGRAPLHVTFTDSSTNTPTSWLWNFGDGSSVDATVPDPVHTYASAGTYTVALTATNSAGSNTFTRTSYITASPAAVTPVANFVGTPTSGALPLTVAFTDISTNTPTSWIWNFGDGSSSNYKNPDHTYTTAGTYTVTLTATNSAGSNSLTRTNYISVTSGVVTPVANFVGTPTSGTAPLTVTFTDSSTNTPTSWSWSFGDGSFSTLKNPAQKNPTHIYTGPGWVGREGHSSVVMPDGSIVLMGGYDHTGYRNDVWRSTDNGVTWTQQI
jgi:PKD repeat protein